MTWPKVGLEHSNMVAFILVLFVFFLVVVFYASLWLLLKYQQLKNSKK